MSVLPPYTVTVIAIQASKSTIWYWLPQTITAIFSIAIAGIALCVSIREARKTQKHNLRESIRMRKHNHLSVKPLLDIMTKTAPGEEKGTAEMHIDLLNVGVGPAIIKRYAVFFDDKEIVVNTHKAKEEISNLIESRLPSVLKHGIGSLTSIAAGGCQTMLYAKIMGPEKDVNAFAKRLGFKIDYQSIYENEPFVCAPRNTSDYPKDKSPSCENQKG